MPAQKTKSTVLALLSQNTFVLIAEFSILSFAIPLLSSEKLLLLLETRLRCFVMDKHSLKVVDIVALTAVVLLLTCPASKSTHISLISP